MAGLFENYNVALLDASFFAGDMTAMVRYALREVKVYVSETFNAEVMQYRQMLSPGKRKDYDEDIRFIQKEIPLKRLDFASCRGKIPGVEEFHNDTWGVLNLLVSMGAKKFVLVTADQILIQRIVLKDLNVDIYDLSRGRFLKKADFPAFREEYTFDASDLVVESADCDERVGDGDPLYRKNGPPVVLGRQIKAGLEARLFLAKQDQRMIIKVFKKDRLPQSKLDNILKIQGINRKMDVDWALFPIDVVYYDQACTAPAGFTEGYALTRENLDDNPLYLGDVDLPDSYLQTRLSDSIRLCLQVIRQVRYLNSYGFLVSDFNMGNFALPTSAGACVQMWDTDSFGYEQYFSGYCSGSRTSREYDITEKEGAIDFCSEAVYLFAFGVLSLGDAPISEFSGKFKYDNPNYAAAYRKDLFPENLWKLFAGVFRREKTPSVEVLMLELQAALEVCQENRAKDQTYKALLFGVVEEEEPASNPPQTVTGTTVANGTAQTVHFQGQTPGWNGAVQKQIPNQNKGGQPGSWGAQVSGQAGAQNQTAGKQNWENWNTQAAPQIPQTGIQNGIPRTGVQNGIPGYTGYTPNQTPPPKKGMPGWLIGLIIFVAIGLLGAIMATLTQ